MTMKWLRENKYAAMLLTLIRLYLGWRWLTAGWGKISAATPFDASGFVKGAIAKPIMENGTDNLVYPNYVAFLKNFALPNIKIFNLLVPWGEFLIGMGLILGCLTAAAAFFGIMLNFIYLFAGSLSSNPWMVLLGFIIIVAGSNAGKIGIDYVLIPNLRSLFKQNAHATRGKLKESA
jgi:thiosulfate dehydrogenase [quinone] large subunit